MLKDLLLLKLFVKSLSFSLSAIKTNKLTLNLKFRYQSKIQVHEGKMSAKVSHLEW